MCCCCAVFVIVVVVTLSVVLPTHFATDTGEENRYTSGDTRLNSLDTFFCKGAQVSSQDYIENVPMHIYLLSKEPPLTDRNNFTVNNAAHISKYDYKYWHFYLHPNSNITVSACMSSGRPYSFYIIEGSSNFNKWKDDPSSTYARADLYVSKVCSSQNQTLSFKVGRSDHYYLSYYALYNVTVRQSLYVERYEYSTDAIFPSRSCEVSVLHSSCSVNTDMLSRYNRVLLKIPFNANSNFDSPYTVNYKCLSRPVAYVIVTVVPFVAVVSCCLVLLVAILCFKRSQRRSYELLVEPCNQDDKAVEAPNHDLLKSYQ